MNARIRNGLIGGLIAIVLVVGAGLWWFLRDDAPDEVSLDGAVAELTDSSGTSAPGSADPDATDSPGSSPGPGGLIDGVPTIGDPSELVGQWQIDTSIGDFSFEQSTGTFVGFRVDEELRGVGAVTAVGRTPTVAGTMTISANGNNFTIDAVTIDAQLTDLTTNDSRRDGKARDALDVRNHPIAQFVLHEPIEVPSSAAEGSDFAAVAVGELTVKGVTQPVEFPIEARLVGETVVVVGSAPVVFADYGVEAPSAPIVVSVQDEGVIEFQLFLTR